jgi:mannosyltransferase
MMDFFLPKKLFHSEPPQAKRNLLSAGAVHAPSPSRAQNRLFYWSQIRNAAFAIPFTVQPPEAPTRDSATLPDLSILALLTAAAAALRFHALTAKSFWFDEGVSVGIARLDGYNFLRILWRREANMSFYYLLLRVWLHLGHSEFFVRTLSVLFGVAAIPAIYFLGRRLFDSQIALTAAALLCVNAYHVHYSQETRGYSLTVFLCILSSLYFVQFLESPSRGNRVTYILLSVLAVYAHFFSGLVLAAHWLSLRFLDPAPKETKKLWLAIALAVFPAVAFVATTGAGPLSWIQRPGLHDLWQLALYLTGNSGAILVCLYAAACLAAVAGNLDWKKKRVSGNNWRSRCLLLWIFFPALLILTLSIARPVFLPRYFIFSMPALLLLAASGLTRIRSGWIFAAVLLVFLGISLRGTAAYYQERSSSPNQNWRAASQYVLSNSRPGDALIFHIAMGRLPYDYYRSLQTPPAAGPDVLYPHHGAQITFLDFVEKPDYSQLANEIPQHPRVWFVITSASIPTGLDKTAAALSSVIGATEPAPQSIKDFGGIQVVLYSKPDSQ